METQWTLNINNTIKTTNTGQVTEQPRPRGLIITDEPIINSFMVIARRNMEAAFFYDFFGHNLIL